MWHTPPPVSAEPHFGADIGAWEVLFCPKRQDVPQKWRCIYGTETPSNALRPETSPAAKTHDDLRQSGSGRFRFSFQRDVTDIAELELVSIQLLPLQVMHDFAQALEPEGLRAQGFLYWIAQELIRIAAEKILLEGSQLAALQLHEVTRDPGRRKTPTGIIEIQWSCFSSSRSSRLFVAHNGLRTPSSSYS